MAGSPIDSSFQFSAVTKSDTAVLTYNNHAARAKAIFVGGAGDLVIKNDLDTSVTFQNLAAGTLLPVSTTRVMSTGTSATNIIALF
jgi:hypothetical protein